MGILSLESDSAGRVGSGVHPRRGTETATLLRHDLSIPAAHTAKTPEARRLHLGGSYCRRGYFPRDPRSGAPFERAAAPVGEECTRIKRRFPRTPGPHRED